MKKFIKILSLMALVLTLGLSLISCGSSGFYKNYHDAGADIDKDNCFEVIKVKKAKDMITNKESFVLFLGSYKIDSCVNGVTSIQNEVEYVGYEGTILFIDITSTLKSASDITDTAKTLGMKETSLAEVQTLICLIYKNGNLIVNSNDDSLSGDNSAKFVIGATFSFKAVVDFINETEEYQRNVD